VRLFCGDPDRDGVFMTGKIGATAEEKAAYLIKEQLKKPVLPRVVGVTVT
jgi:succinyl-CoA synthetase alpha subunit